MEPKELSIDSIWEGQSPSRYFGKKGQFESAIAIDPDLPILSTGVRTSGFIVPVGAVAITSTNVTSPIIREITHPKDNLIWTIQTNGRIVTFTSALAGERLIGTVAGDNATWGEYYNNYIYVFGTGASKNDVSRIGPLNTLPYDGQSGNFTVGLTVTGGTSAATGIIIADVDGGATGTLTLSNITGHFVDNETITDTSTGSASVNRTDASLITDAVWTGATLGSLTALSNTIYPSLRSTTLPNHVAHVHGDGSLYFCDFGLTGTTIAGQGAIHRINTKKVTNEGDTNGTTVPSAYNVLDLPFGFYPTAISSQGTSLLVVGIYSVDTTINQGKSAFILWDPTDTTSFYLGPVFLPDPLATAVVNGNGVNYIFTGNAVNGVRLSKYLGGESVEEIMYQEEGMPPLAGAVDVLGNRVVWGGYTTNPEAAGVVWAWGSKDARLPKGLHCVARATSTGTSPIVTAIRYVQQNSNITPKLMVAWRDASARGIDQYSTTATLDSSIRFMFNIGRKFSITRISIPLAGAVAANTTISPSCYFDDLSVTKNLTAINNTNYASHRKIIYKGAELKDYIGQNNFMFELTFTGTNPLPVALPITFQIEVWEDEASA